MFPGFNGRPQKICSTGIYPGPDVCPNSEFPNTWMPFQELWLELVNVSEGFSRLQRQQFPMVLKQILHISLGVFACVAAMFEGSVLAIRKKNCYFVNFPGAHEEFLILKPRS